MYEVKTTGVTKNRGKGTGKLNGNAKGKKSGGDYRKPKTLNQDAYRQSLVHIKAPTLIVMRVWGEGVLEKN